MRRLLLISLVAASMTSAAHADVNVNVNGRTVVHRVPGHGFSLELPLNWKVGTEFLHTTTYQAFRRRSPIFAQEYQSMLHTAARKGVWFIAVDASRRALVHATRELDVSHGLFPTIFVVPGRVLGPVPLWPAGAVVPTSWSGHTPDQAASAYCNPKPAPGESCRFTFTTAAGRLGVVMRRDARRPAGRPALILGWSSGVGVDGAGQSLEPVPAAAFDLGWSSLRYDR
jgi:hypothetical protein